MQATRTKRLALVGGSGYDDGMARTATTIGGVKCVTETRFNRRDGSTCMDVYADDGETPIILGARSMGAVTMALSEATGANRAINGPRPAVADAGPRSLLFSDGV